MRLRARDQLDCAPVFPSAREDGCFPHDGGDGDGALSGDRPMVSKASGGGGGGLTRQPRFPPVWQQRQ